MSAGTEPAPPADHQVWRRIMTALGRRPGRAQAAVAALCGLLAFALVTQVHATSASGGLAAARPDDLVGILADLDSRAERLHAEIADLQASERRLSSGSGQGAAALVDRSGGTADLGVPFFPLIRLDVPTYSADALPPELAAVPAIKPGSRAAA